MAKKQDTKGITVKRDDDFSEWFTQLIQKAELIEYSPVSGCYILRPNSFYIWERAKDYFDTLIKKDGIQNAYFPLFIPENLLTKEAQHVEGFAPEVAWVERGGSTPLKERLAIRPTSETIICDTYAKWIRSYKDLPLRLNQWCNVVRWEFKHCTPFLRSREFLWQEGHTCFSNQKEAEAEVFTILDFYEKLFEDLYAVPVLKGRKSEAEKFAGADFTMSVEAYLPNGKSIQGATSHYLGQNFSKAFEIKFTDNNEKQQFVHQNSWGFSTRSIGMLIMMHSDDKGLVLPPKVSRIQAVIIPILFDKTKGDVLKVARRIKDSLARYSISVELDEREEYSPGWKYNQYELQGVPVRIEIGPRDLEKKQVMVVRRDTGEKRAIAINDLTKKIPSLLDTIQIDLFEKAKKLLDSSIVEVSSLKEAQFSLKKGKVIFAPWCGSPESEEDFKGKTGAKSLNSPLKQPSISGKKCFLGCGDAKSWFYFGKSY